MKPNIALTGLSRSGKDSVAARLVERHGYVRVAFADRLKEAALKSDPFIPLRASGVTVRLSAVIANVGWETAKDQFPEVRRFLQDYGQTIREIRPRFWIDAAFADIDAAWAAGRPVVVTDVRYANEANTLTASGFELYRVTRPGLVPGQHRSEREMLSFRCPELANDGTLADLHWKVDRLMD